MEKHLQKRIRDFPETKLTFAEEQDIATRFETHGDCGTFAQTMFTESFVCQWSGNGLTWQVDGLRYQGNFMAYQGTDIVLMITRVGP